MRLRTVGESFRATNVKRGPACWLVVTGLGPAPGAATDVELAAQAIRTMVAAMPKRRLDLSPRTIGRRNYDDSGAGQTVRAELRTGSDFQPSEGSQPRQRRGEAEHGGGRVA
jgi:hypothetical protein